MTRVPDQGHGTAVPTDTRTTIVAKERKVSLLEIELSRERIRDRDRELRGSHAAAVRVRAARRAREDARIRVLRLLLAR